MLIHRGVYRQRGAGLGGFFKGLFNASKPLFRKVFSLGKKVANLPIVKDVIQDTKDEIITVGTSTLSDALRGENIKDSMIKNATTAKENIKEKLIERVSDAVGVKRKPKSDSQTKKSKRSKDIFDEED